MGGWGLTSSHLAIRVDMKNFSKNRGVGLKIKCKSRKTKSRWETGGWFLERGQGLKRTSYKVYFTTLIWLAA